MVSPNRSEVVLIDLGAAPNQVIGHEQANRRPCLVIQTMNYSKLAIIVPLTSRIPPKQIFSIVKIQSGTGGLTQDSYALCHQIRAVSYHRIVRTMGVITNRDFHKVTTVLADFLAI